MYALTDNHYVFSCLLLLCVYFGQLTHYFLLFWVFSGPNHAYPLCNELPLSPGCFPDALVPGVVMRRPIFR